MSDSIWWSGNLTCTAFYEIRYIYPDFLPYADDTYGMVSVMGLEPLMFPQSSGRFWEHGQVTTSLVLEACGYAYRCSAARSAK